MRISFNTMLVVVLTGVVFLSNGCKDDENPVTPKVTPISDDVFPLVVGHQLVYNGYLRDKTADTNITATGAVFETRWTIISNSAPSPVGGTATAISDSTRVPTGLLPPNPTTVWSTSTLMVKRETPTGTANFSFMNNIGRFYRLNGINRSDSLRWILLANLSAGVGGSWTAFDSSWATAGGSIRLQIVASWELETVTVNNVTYTNAYKLTAVRNVYLGTSTNPVSTAPTATLWLVKDIGPVKMILNSDGETNGVYRELLSKNF